MICSWMSRWNCTHIRNRWKYLITTLIWTVLLSCVHESCGEASLPRLDWRLCLKSRFVRMCHWSCVGRSSRDISSHGFTGFRCLNRRLLWRIHLICGRRSRGEMLLPRWAIIKYENIVCSGTVSSGVAMKFVVDSEGAVISTQILESTPSSIDSRMALWLNYRFCSHRISNR